MFCLFLGLSLSFLSAQNPNPNSRGHTTKRGLRVPTPNSRGHVAKRSRDSEKVGVVSLSKAALLWRP